MRLKGKVAIITGSSKGIGRAIAEVFAREGAQLVITGTTIESANDTVNKIIEKYNCKPPIPFALDVSNFKSCESLIKTSIDNFSKIDILVNNAGITKDNLILRIKESEWDEVISVNLKGVFNCIKAVIKPMLKQKHGRILNIASIVGQIGNIGQINYSASKGGVIAITKTCARELASRNILVNAIAPGFINTSMTDKLTDEQKHAMSSLIPLRRFGNVFDVANAALFLVSDDSAYITGHVLSVNGGMYM
ncbi:MAG: 3-oxoacyl-[acyl-carrier-protein] reductase [Endomicrobium sp.]|jgi:3-oxoacyl-[acyl-carrier protein] reductase|nr:3-oxoacyl-[acyl-carrier-protein] reductase [Endomicrobium sp.]